MNVCTSGFAGILILLFAAASPAEIHISVGHNGNADARPAFEFQAVSRPASNDAAATAIFSLVDGRRDFNGGDVAKLQDGKVPLDEDAPAETFFFRAGTDGGRLLVDLGRAIEIQQVGTYSWHPNTRGPQVYRLYGSEGTANGFNAQPKRDLDPETCGWSLRAVVDTRPAAGEGGGQYGVNISDSSGAIGKYRYLLFDISRTEDTDAFGNTFYCEIDVIDRNAPAPEPVAVPVVQTIRDLIEADGGKYRITIDTSETPDLTEWARREIAPMVRDWYPKMVNMLPSEGYEAPARFSIVFSAEMRGVAATSGTRIRCAARWMRDNLKGEALGAVFHEMVHVVQQYGRAPRAPGTSRPPGWLTEGITDYLRWYQFEPQMGGAEISRRNLNRARYDGSYRITANFLNWVSEKHGQDFVPKLNAAIREGRYSEAVWKTLTGHSVQELNDGWKADLEKTLTIDAGALPEAAAGADGESTTRSGP